MKLLPCLECRHENSFTAVSPDRAECRNCGRVWHLDWSSKLDGVRIPKLTLVDDGAQNWHRIGCIATDVLSSLKATERHRDHMSALQRMNEHHENGGAS